MARLILLDRDGVLNADSKDYVKDANEWVALPGALDAVARLKAAGFLVGVCSNQSGVGRGIFTKAALERVHGELTRALGARGVVLDAVHYCTHHPDEGCACRKPRPGMLEAAINALGVTAADTTFVGDSRRDFEAARAAGCAFALVRTGNGAATEAATDPVQTVWVGDDLAAFARWVAWRS